METLAGPSLQVGGNDGAPPSSSPFEYAWVVAVVIALAASTISNIGLNLQKYALNLKATKRGKPATIAVVWALGMGGIVAGALCDFAALGFGAQSIVAPLGSWWVRR